MGAEIELKLELPEGAGTPLIAELWPAGEWQSQKQSTIYFDTPANEVRQRGYTLRVRTVGERFVQTVKSLDGGAALFQRGEWEHQIDGPAPDAERLRHTPLGSLDVAQLRPVVRSDVNRSTCLIRESGSEVELAVDQGIVRAGRRKVPVSELEIELIHGDPAEGVAIAHRAAETVPLKIGVLSKAERGFALIDGRLGKVSKAEPVPVRAGMTVAEGFAAILTACLRHFRLNEPLVITERSPEALHQARVAMRRLRSALSLCRTAIADGEFDGLREELRWFTDQLGEARNLDVYLQRELGVDERTAIKERRETAYERVIAAMDSHRIRTLFLDLIAWSLLGEWRCNAKAELQLEPYAAERIDRLWRGIAHARDVSAMDEKQRHQLRIRVKKFRYALEFMEALYARGDERRRKFGKAVEELQEALGHLNDVVVARSLFMADAWPIEPAEPTADEWVCLDEAEHALGRLRRIGPYWRDAA